jgi:uncharacterized protein DUF748
MAAGRAKRWGLIASLVLLTLVAGGIVCLRVALGLLKDRVVEALGPGSEVGDVRVGWASVDVDGLRIKAPRGWPAGDTLRAERVTIVPSPRSLLSRNFRLHSVTVVRPYLSALRSEQGALVVVPTLLAGAGGYAAPSGSSTLAAAPRTATIGRVTLRDGVLELFDATVKQPPLKLRLERIQGTVNDIVIPALSGRSELELSGVLKGVQRDGTVAVAGWAEIASNDSSLHTKLRSADMVALQPYLVKAGETDVRRGTLDLDLQSDVRANRLKAPGTLTISDLELSQPKDAVATFMGLPRDAVVAYLKNKDNKIVLSFVLEGDIDDPRFTLNEALSTRVALSMAETLGLSLGGVAKGVGGLGQKGVEAAGEATKGAVQQLFGGRKKEKTR